MTPLIEAEQLNSSNNAPKRWLITGGAGFIGTNLIRVLKKRRLATAVRVVDNLSAGAVTNLSAFSEVKTIGSTSVSAMAESDSIELIEGDVVDLQLALDACEGADVVVHLAANTSVQLSLANPSEDARFNVLGTLNYLEAARTHRLNSFIFASSGATTGTCAPPIHEDVLCKPLSPYGASKLAGEAYCFAYHGSYGLKTIGLRFSNVYGLYSGRKGSVVALFLRNALAGRPWVINGDGQQTRDFIFVEDLVDAVIRATTAEKGGEIFQICTGRETSIRDLAEMVKAMLVEEAGIEPSIKFGPSLKGEIARNFADNRKALRDLSWRPRTELEEGVRDTTRWFVGERENAGH